MINAAGPWAAEVGATRRLDVPVVPLRRQVAITVPTSALPAHTPLTIVADDGFHLRVRGDRALLLRPDDADQRVDPFDTLVRRVVAPRHAHAHQQRLPRTA